MLKKATLIVLLLLMRCLALADVFVVTSNADSGSGTLREALTLAAANGNAVKDYINFNLADLSIAGRTIIVTTQLPDVSSNLVIDGSTQPGSKFGVSSAKVCIIYQVVRLQSETVIRIVNQHDVEIYGLYLKNVPNLSEWPNRRSWEGIDILGGKNIAIGAAGKGNVIFGFEWALSVNQDNFNEVVLENLKLKNNFFYVDVDGQSFSTFEPQNTYLRDLKGQIDIGGTESERNLFASGLFIYQNNYGNINQPANANVNSEATINVQNNNIGVDYRGQTGSPKCYGLYLGTSHPSGRNIINVTDNIIKTTGGSDTKSILIGNAAYKITILRNYIGTNRERNKSFETGGILASEAKEIQIGSDDPADANYITNCKPVTIYPFANVKINKNSFYCADNSAMQLNVYGAVPLPIIKIINITTNSVKGIATPNSKIELFYADNCGTCSPQKYFASTTADVNGNWQYDGALTNAVIASATLDKVTSEFARSHMDVSNVKITACDGRGSMTGVVALGAKNITWYDENGNVVGRQADLINLPDGKYKLVVDNGACGIETIEYTISSGALALSAANMKVKKASCSSSDGEITGITYNTTGTVTAVWTNQNGDVVGNNIDLAGVPPGSYILNIKSSNNCARIYGPVVVDRATGPAINQLNVSIQSTNCGQTTGSITGITATGTGTLKYTWKNAAQQIVAATADLINKAAGQYRLEVADETQCGAVYTTVLTIPETNGIILNDAGVTITPSSCNTDNGSVKGITVNGATSYKWTNAGNVTVATTVDLLNAPAGSYTFTASNTFGCLQTREYTIGAQTLTQYPAYAETISAACAGMANGSIAIAIDSKVNTMRWVNGLNATIGTSATAANLPAGEYRFFVTDANGCEALYKTYTVTEIAPIKIVASSAVITADVCGTKKGSIRNIQATGGAGNYNYEWTNSNNTIIGTTAGIDNLSAGTYKVRVYNANSCAQDMASFTVLNETSQPSAPIVNNIETCNGGNVTIAIANPQTGYKYKLYETALSTTPIAVQPSGKFMVNVKATSDYYISSSFGTCESTRAKVHVRLSVSNLAIANTFTPNGDGINDLWLIPGLDGNTTALVQVFNRTGVKVFESKGYASPFDGRSNGKTLPIGVYYYVINPGQGCKVFSGALTIIR